MNSLASHPLPRRGAVAREQLRAVGLGMRREILIGAALLLGLTLMLAYTHLRSLEDPAYGGLDLVPLIGIPVALLGFVVPLAVWKGEDPARRGYLWSLPVERGWMQLTRNASGWLWFMGAVAVYMLWMWGVSVASGGEPGGSDLRLFMGEDIRRATPADVRIVRIPTPAWQWAVPFTGATVAYLLGSIPALAANHAWRWVAAVLFGWLMLEGISDSMELEALHQGLWLVLEGRYGLETVFTGQVAAVEQYRNAAGALRSVSHDRPDLQAWAGATLLWMGIGTVGTLLAGTRHREG